MDRAGMGMLHHIELWVPSLARAEASWGWLLGELGYKINGEWPEGKSWQAGTTYIVLEQSPARIVVRHDRLRPGLNHLAFYAASREQVDSLWRYAPEHGWRLMFADRHPHAGGPDHYAAYLENQDGFEVELVAPVFETAEPADGPPATADAAAPADGTAPPPGPGPV
jgi:catechol 2,3-dioxygenase-like lactoylglutathione lyase family enzyme